MHTRMFLPLVFFAMSLLDLTMVAVYWYSTKPTLDRVVLLSGFRYTIRSNRSVRQFTQSYLKETTTRSHALPGSYRSNRGPDRVKRITTEMTSHPTFTSPISTSNSNMKIQNARTTMKQNIVPQNPSADSPLIPSQPTTLSYSDNQIHTLKNIILTLSETQSANGSNRHANKANSNNSDTGQSISNASDTKGRNSNTLSSSTNTRGNRNINKPNDLSPADDAEKQDSIKTGFPGNKFPAQLQNWQPSPDSHKYFLPIGGQDAWLYSAFFDGADDTDVVVRGFGIIKRTTPREVICHYLDSQKRWTYLQTGRILPIRERSIFEYLSTSFVCPLSKGDKEPRYLSLAFSNGNLTRWTPSDPLEILYPARGPMRIFTVCYSPFHSNYSSNYQLIQSLELNSILGAEYFIFYNFSISPSTDEILRHYHKQGIATTYQWPLPVLGTWYYGQLAAINDCVYRNRMASRYVVVIDTDEFIIPNLHRDWLDMINAVSSSFLFWESDSQFKSTYRNVVSTSFVVNNTNIKNASNTGGTARTSIKNVKRWPPNIGAFSFRNVLYPFCIDPNQTHDWEILKTNFTESELLHIQRYPNSVFAQFLRSHEIMVHERRSKLIVRPEGIHHASIHKVIRYKKEFGVVHVNIGTAWLHHYHSKHSHYMCNTTDFSIFKYKQSLINRLNPLTFNFSFN